jgi:hypothetical protein
MPDAPTTSAGTVGTTLISGAFPTICVEIAFPDAWDAAAPTWTDMSEYLRGVPGIKIGMSGRADEHSDPTPGTATLVLNDLDRRFDSTNDAGPYGTDVRPLRPIRIRAAWDGTIYYLFRGWVESFATDWPSSGRDAIATLSCTDAFARLSAQDFPLGTALAEALPGDRIDDVLDIAGVPAGLRNLDTGISTMPAVEEASGSLLEHLKAVAVSDGGFLYVMQDGRISYETRTYRCLSETSPRATFGDGGTAFPTEIPYADIDPSKDTDYLYNHAQFTAGDGTGIGEAEDAASLAEYARRTFSKSVLTGFNEARAGAEWIVRRYQEPAVRFLGVTLNGGSSHDDLLPTMLAAYNSNRFTFKTRPVGGGTMELDEFIERRDLSISTSGWMESWSLSPFGDEDPWALGATPADILGTDTTPTW